MKRFNFLAAGFEPFDAPVDGYGAGAAPIGDAIGGQHIGGQLYVLEPGQKMAPYHWEAGQEEWLIVLEGNPTVRTPEGHRDLRAGDVACFVAGPAGAHQVLNRSEVPVWAIMISERRRPNIVVYPDSNKLGARTDDVRLMFRMEDAVEYWDREP